MFDEYVISNSDDFIIKSNMDFSFTAEFLNTILESVLFSRWEPNFQQALVWKKENELLRFFPAIWVVIR